MKSIEKVISTDSSGEIKGISPSEFESIFSDKSTDIDECTDRSERLLMMVELADFCVECGEERKAVDLYRDMLRFGGCSAYERDRSSALGRQALHAYETLRKLASSDDEFVWEQASQALSDIRPTFTKE